MRIPKIEIWGSIAAVVGSILLYRFKPLTAIQFSAFLLNIECLIFLASLISFQIAPLGQGIFGKLKWVLLEFQKFVSPALFSPIKFYLGLLFLVANSLINVILI